MTDNQSNYRCDIIEKRCTHVVTLSNGAQVAMREDNERLAICSLENNGQYVDAFVADITADGVLVMPNSGGACEDIARGLKAGEEGVLAKAAKKAEPAEPSITKDERRVRAMALCVQELLNAYGNAVERSCGELDPGDIDKAYRHAIDAVAGTV